MSKWMGLFLAVLLAGCASVEKVDSGARAVGARLIFELDGAWNQVNLPGDGTAKVWTMEGLPIDRLLVYSGVKDGDEIAANPPGGNAGPARKSLRFRKGMQSDELVSLFETMLTRDGSIFKLERLAPSSFGGSRGFRFEYSLIRKSDSARLSGLGYGTVDRGELFAMLYVAPRLTFFPRHRQRVERMASSARLKAG